MKFSVLGYGILTSEVTTKACGGYILIRIIKMMVEMQKKRESRDIVKVVLNYSSLVVHFHTFGMDVHHLVLFILSFFLQLFINKVCFFFFPFKIANLNQPMSQLYGSILMVVMKTTMVETICYKTICYLGE